MNVRNVLVLAVAAGLVSVAGCATDYRDYGGPVSGGPAYGYNDYPYYYGSDFHHDRDWRGHDYGHDRGHDEEHAVAASHREGPSGSEGHAAAAHAESGGHGMSTAGGHVGSGGGHR